MIADWSPNIRILGRESETRGHDAHYGKLVSIQKDGPIYKVQITPKAAFPKAMADNRDVGAAVSVLCGKKRTPDEWMNAEQRKEICRDALADKLFRIAV